MTAEPVESPAHALIWPQAQAAPLPRFLLLAVLLHLWMVVMLGNAPGGTAPEGRGVYGRLNITLQGAAAGPEGAAQPPQPAATATGAAGTAERPRFGGAVRDTLPQPNAPAGAARLGDWSPTRGEPDGQRAAPAPPPPPPGQAPPTVAPAPVPDVQAPAVPDAAPRSTVDLPPNPRVAVPSPDLALQRPLAPMVQAEAALPRLAAGPEPVPVLAANVPTVSGSTVAAPVKQLGPVPAARAAAAQLPLQTATPVVPPAVAALPAVPLPSALLPPASAERSLASRLQADRAALGLPALAASGRAGTGPVLAGVPAPSPVLAAPVPVSVPVLAAALAAPALAKAPPVAAQPAAAAPASTGPAAAAAALAPTAPATTVSINPAAVPPPAATAASPTAPAVAPALAVAAPTSPAAPAAGEPATAQLPRSAPGAVPGAQAALPSAAGGPRAESAQGLTLPSVAKLGNGLPQAGQGSSDAGSRVGADVATAPSAPASAPQRLNLELPRMRGGELSRYSTTGVLPALPRPPEVPDKLGGAIEKAAKEDCRKAYGGAGLLAVVPLLIDAVRDGGCKW